MNKIKKLKLKFRSSKLFWELARLISSISNKNIIQGKGNSIHYNTTIIRKTKIFINGNRNVIQIKSGCRINGTEIFIRGNDNFIEIGDDCNIKGAKFWIEDNNNSIRLGKMVTIEKETQLACIEGCRIIIGSDCMFSSSIAIRTGDSHSIVDLGGKRINPSKDVIIGSHVWIGNNATLNKGVEISNNCVVGSGSILTKSFLKENCIIAGIPATIVKAEIDWRRERIPL